ncbi:sigma-54-dependent Fis family transcriptional regulator [Microbacterium sp.]|uniref:sigma-54-dependent Fis family transcriptional regulator n=1 Tax=Microbacterium sp. TaxID=51671 RepID=UPI003A8A6BDD
MTLSAAPAAPIDLTPSRARLDAMQRARDAFLADPSAPPDISLRPEIIHSWRRSLAHGVDRLGDALPHTDMDGRSERLQRVGAPIMQRLGSQLEGATAWAMLLDRDCAQLGPAVGDARVRSVTVDRGSQPGALFGESSVGTNGAGTAAERLESFVVVGPEHFRDSERSIVSVGAPVRDAQNRIAGFVALNCRLAQANSILVPFARDVAWAIGHELAQDAKGVQQELLDRYSALARRPSQAALAVADDVLIVNAAARQLTRHGIKVERVAERALDAAHAGERAEFEIAEQGELLHVRVTPVTLRSGDVAAVATLARPSATPRDAAAPRRVQPDPVVHVLRRARAAGILAAVIGEPGSGKMRLVRDALGEADAVIVDARTIGDDPASFLAHVEQACHAAPTVVIRRLDAAPDRIRTDVARIVSTGDAWVVATGTAVPDLLGGQDELFPIVVTRTALRERGDEFTRIVDTILADVRTGGHPVRCSPPALAVLSRQRWPGNVTQLRRVLVTAAVTATGGEVTLDDLPADALVDERARDLTKLERAERELVLSSLRDASWNREAAAKALGISRATMYRKLKQFGISVPSSRS